MRNQSLIVCRVLSLSLMASSVLALLPLDAFAIDNLQELVANIPADPPYDERKAEAMINAKIAKAELNNPDYKQRNARDSLIYRQKEKALSDQLAASIAAHSANSILIGISDQQTAFYKKYGQYVKAVKTAKYSLHLQEATYGKDSPELLPGLDNLAELYKIVLDYRNLMPVIARSLAIREKGLRPGDPAIAKSVFELAYFYQFSGQYEKAKPLFQRSLKLWRNILAHDGSNLAALEGCRLVYQAVNQYSKQNTYYWQELNAIRKKYGQGTLEEADLLKRNSKPLKNKIADLQKALQIYKAIKGEDSAETASTLYELGRLLSRDGLSKEPYQKALPMFERAYKIRSSILPINHPDTTAALFERASCAYFTANNDQAEKLYWLAIAMDAQREGIHSHAVCYKLAQGPVLLYCEKFHADSVNLSHFAQKYGYQDPYNRRKPLKYNL